MANKALSPKSSYQVVHLDEIDEMTDGRWLVNPGSIGQPRDGDPRAAWMMLDTDSLTATFHRVEYPVEAAAKSILDAGLPRQLADRLFSGQ